ncbi:hypothetical protein RUM43_007335 [Polyplax serrata]|uniref:Uncharacterized protein n=1 Tax=Polyplax serrata TaxID=468196 RepID=A0AAN8P8E0_POLSC
MEMMPGEASFVSGVDSTAQGYPGNFRGRRVLNKPCKFERFQCTFLAAPAPQISFYAILPLQKCIVWNGASGEGARIKGVKTARGVRSNIRKPRFVRNPRFSERTTKLSGIQQEDEEAQKKKKKKKPKENFQSAI